MLNYLEWIWPSFWCVFCPTIILILILVYNQWLPFSYMHSSACTEFTIIVCSPWLSNVSGTHDVYVGKWACTLGIDVLALITCLMFPRLVKCIAYVIQDIMSPPDWLLSPLRIIFSYFPCERWSCSLSSLWALQRFVFVDSCTPSGRESCAIALKSFTCWIRYHYSLSRDQAG